MSNIRLLHYFLVTKTCDFVFKSSDFGEINKCPLKRDSSCIEFTGKRINCTFLMRKRSRFVETSAHANRSSLFSRRRSEIAPFINDRRENGCNHAVSFLLLFTRFTFDRIYVIVYTFARTYRQWVDVCEYKQVQNAMACYTGGKKEDT